MHLANQSSRKLESYPRVHISRQAIPEFNGGNTLDKREATDPRGKNPNKQMNQQPIQAEAEQRGTLGQGTIKNIGLPILQEARN